MQARFGLLILLGGCHSPSPSSPSTYDPSERRTFVEAIDEISQRQGVLARATDPPCVVTDEAACESQCPDVAWACALAGDAHRARRDRAGAASFYRRACAGSDPDGCAEVALGQIADTQGHGRSPTPYALLWLSCYPGLSLRACKAGPALFDARIEWLRAQGEDRDQTSLSEARGNMAAVPCEESIDPTCLVAAPEQLAQDKENSERLMQQLADCRRANPELECYLYGDEVRTWKPQEVSSSPPARPRPPPVEPSAPPVASLPAGQLTRSECSAVVSEACWKLEPTYRWQGVTDEHRIMELNQKCIAKNQFLVDACARSGCGERWRHCIVDQSATLSEIDECMPLLSCDP